MTDAAGHDRSCDLCRRRVVERTRHHLIPRARHRNKRNKKAFGRDEVRGRLAWLCRPCHKQIHSLLSEKDLERDYNTVERLAAHPQVAEFVAWIRGKPDGTKVTSRRSRRRSVAGEPRSR